MTDAGPLPLGASPRNRWTVDAASASLLRTVAPSRPVTVRDRGRAVTFDIARTAIIVVDMQNDFCHPDGWLAHIGVDIAPARTPIEPLNHLLPVLREAEVPVLWVNWGNRPDRMNLSPALLHVYNPTGAGVGLGDPLPKSGEPVLEAGSWAAAIVDDLETDPVDIHVAKHRMSGFPDTPLASILRNLSVDTLLFAGVNLDQCVMCTLQDANFLGFDCLLVEDCCATTSPRFCREATLYNVRQCFGFVTDGPSLISGLASR